MCGRFTIMFDPEELREQLELGELPADLVPNSNISPGQFVPVVINPVTRNVELYKWGLIPGWAKDEKIGYKMFNARAETIAEKPSFKVPFLRRRCLMPADGFYEWKLEGEKKYPYLFTLKNRVPFMFAGLWDSWPRPDGKELRSCTIVTTEPNTLLAQFHNRMPVILDKADRWRWLEEGTPPEALKSMLKAIDVAEMDTPIRVDHL